MRPPVRIPSPPPTSQCQPPVPLMGGKGRVRAGAYHETERGNTHCARAACLRQTSRRISLPDRRRHFRSALLDNWRRLENERGLPIFSGSTSRDSSAWWLWRTIYLRKLPRFEKKVRVLLDWTLDLIFSKDLVQFLTLRAPHVSDSQEK